MIQSAVIGGRSWRFPMVRGIVTVMYGSAFIGTSDPSVERIAMAFGCYAAVDGALAVAGVLRNTACGVPPWCLLIRGLAGLALGIATLLGRLDSPVQIHLVLMTWALVAGLFEIVTGLCARQRLDGDIYQILSGLTMMGLGVTLMLLPPHAVNVAWPLLSVFAVIAGTMLVFTGLRTDVLRGQMRGRSDVTDRASLPSHPDVVGRHVFNLSLGRDSAQPDGVVLAGEAGRGHLQDNRVAG